MITEAYHSHNDGSQAVLDQPPPLAALVPDIDQADWLFEQGMHIAAGTVAWGILMDRLRDACYFHGHRPHRETGPWSWVRGFRPNQYSESLEKSGAYGDEDAAEVRRMDVLGLSIISLLVTDTTVIRGFLDDVRTFLESHPSDYDARKSEWAGKGGER